MFASWARRIFIVTDQQVPAWLDSTDPRIQVVDHREIFSDPSVLPVFNSHAIESQLHHIPDLAEHYLYLNDDMLFGRPVRPELFFLGNGLGRFFLSPLTLDLDPPSPRDLPVMSAAKVNRAVLEQRFGATVSHKFLHAALPAAAQRARADGRASSPSCSRGSPALALPAPRRRLDPVGAEPLLRLRARPGGARTAGRTSTRTSPPTPTPARLR